MDPNNKPIYSVSWTTVQGKRRRTRLEVEVNGEDTDIEEEATKMAHEHIEKYSKEHQEETDLESIEVDYVGRHSERTLCQKDMYVVYWYTDQGKYQAMRAWAENESEIEAEAVRCMEWLSGAWKEGAPKRSTLKWECFGKGYHGAYTEHCPHCPSDSEDDDEVEDDWDPQEPQEPEKPRPRSYFDLLRDVNGDGTGPSGSQQQ